MKILLIAGHGAGYIKRLIRADIASENNNEN